MMKKKTGRKTSNNINTYCTIHQLIRVKLLTNGAIHLKTHSLIAMMIQIRNMMRSIEKSMSKNDY